MQAARALLSPRRCHRKRLRLRRTASGRSLPYNLRFPGQYYQAETGLNQNVNRDYDPQVGRFDQSDPLGLRGGNSTYAYVSNKPITFTDPAGLEPCFMVGYYRTPWEEVPGSEGKPWYELVQVLASDATGIAAGCVWQKLQTVQDRRDVYVELQCKQCNYAGCSNPACRWVDVRRKTGSETRTRTDVTRKIGFGVGLNIGGEFNPEEPSHYLCINPWTGGRAGGEFGP